MAGANTPDLHSQCDTCGKGFGMSHGDMGSELHIPTIDPLAASRNPTTTPSCWLAPKIFNNNEHSLDNNNGDSNCSSKRKVIVFIAFASLDQSQNYMSSCDVMII